MGDAVNLDYIEIKADIGHPLYLQQVPGYHTRRSIYVGPFIGTSESRGQQRVKLWPYDPAAWDRWRAHGLMRVYWSSLMDAQRWRGRHSKFSVIRPAQIEPIADNIEAIDALLAAAPDPNRQDWYDEWPSRHVAGPEQLDLFNDDDTDDDDDD